MSELSFLVVVESCRLFSVNCLLTRPSACRHERSHLPDREKEKCFNLAEEANQGARIVPESQFSSVRK
jgi:hypothetical protein